MAMAMATRSAGPGTSQAAGAMRCRRRTLDVHHWAAGCRSISLRARPGTPSSQRIERRLQSKVDSHSIIPANEGTESLPSGVSYSRIGGVSRVKVSAPTHIPTIEVGSFGARLARRI